MTELVIKLNAVGISLMHLPEAEEKLDRMYKAIDCSCIGIGNFRLLTEEFGDKYCVVYDEEALLKPNYINIMASYLYGAGEHKQFVCGDVLIMKNKFTDEGIETVGLDTDDVKEVAWYLEQHRETALKDIKKAFEDSEL